jgi:hypothetical protein
MKNENIAIYCYAYSYEKEFFASHRTSWLGLIPTKYYGGLAFDNRPKGHILTPWQVLPNFP